MSKEYDIIKDRIDNAGKALDQFADYDIDTVSALIILESKQKEIRNMLRGVDKKKHYSTIITFLQKDNPNMDITQINRYLLLHMFILPNSFKDYCINISFFMIIIGLPIYITYNAYISNIGRGDIIAVIMIVFFLSFLGVGVITIMVFIFLFCD